MRTRVSKLPSASRCWSVVHSTSPSASTDHTRPLLTTGRPPAGCSCRIDSQSTKTELSNLSSPTSETCFTCYWHVKPWGGPAASGRPAVPYPLLRSLGFARTVAVKIIIGKTEIVVNWQLMLDTLVYDLAI